jgi:hypothetical protein
VPQWRTGWAPHSIRLSDPFRLLKLTMMSIGTLNPNTMLAHAAERHGMDWFVLPRHILS